MLFLVGEDPNIPITNFIQEATEVFPKSSQVYVNKRNFEEVRKKTSSKPLLTDNWCLVIRPNKLTGEELVNFLSDANFNIIHCSTEKELDSFKAELDKQGISYQLINNFKLPKQVIENYIMDVLDCSPKTATLIAKRSNYFLPRIYNNVSLLEGIGEKTTDTVVRKYTENYGVASVSSLVEHMLGYRTVAKKSLLALLSNNRYNAKYLYKDIYARLEEILTCYDYIIQGSLRYDNYTSFSIPDTNISDYVKRKSLEYFAEISYERIYLLYISLKIEPRQNIITLTKYITERGVVK